METCVDGTSTYVGIGATARAATVRAVPSAGPDFETGPRSSLLVAAGAKSDVASVAGVPETHPDCAATTGENTGQAAQSAVVAGVLRVSGMPRRFRPVVEELMARCVTSDSAYVVPGEDPLYAQWCTRWYKDVPADNLRTLARGTAQSTSIPAGIGCHQPLTGTRDELAHLNRELAALAEEHGFCAAVDFA